MGHGFHVLNVFIALVQERFSDLAKRQKSN